MNEVVNSASVLNPGLTHLDVTLSFNELRLEAAIEYVGVPLEIVKTAPTLEELCTDEGIAALSTFIIRQYADQVKVKERGGVTSVSLEFDH